MSCIDETYEEYVLFYLFYYYLIFFSFFVVVTVTFLGTLYIIRTLMFP